MIFIGRGLNSDIAVFLSQVQVDFVVLGIASEVLVAHAAEVRLALQALEVVGL